MSAFWFHYNKPASRKMGVPILTLHYQGACHFVRGIDCRVPVQTRERKRQPHLVMTGSGNVTISSDRAVIRAE
jgi:hypothetical protein